MYLTKYIHGVTPEQVTPIVSIPYDYAHNIQDIIEKS